MHLSAVLVFSFLQFAAASPRVKRWDDMEVKHAWAEIPSGWEACSDAPADHMLDMRIGLKQDRFDELVEHLYQVSDPTHSRYGDHLSKEEVEALVAPHPDSTSLVDDWLTHHEISPSSISRSPAGDWLSITVTVAQAERMLDAKYHVYRPTESRDKPGLPSISVVRTTSYSLPRVLHGHVSVVTPTTYFGNTRAMRSTSFVQPDVAPISDDEMLEVKASLTASPGTVSPTCARIITPDCLIALYNITGYVPRATDKNIIGVAGYLDEFANKADLQTFFERFRPDALGAKFETIQLNGGGNDQNDPGVEANLDIQYTEGLTFPTPNIYYSTGGSPPFIPDGITPTNTNEPYLEWLNFILAQSVIPQTFTTSYGDHEQTVPEDYAITVCNLFAQLGARGSSILFSSGDFGVGGGDCLTNDGTNTLRFQPIFPASCPFVTAVGGTVGINPEIAVDFSGGGFSNYFARPWYQATAVQAFLDGLGTTNTGLFNPTGRGFPDIAAQGLGFQVVVRNRTRSVGGTSASSPAFASVVSLLNDNRLACGKKSLGFLNPLLYSIAIPGLTDITSGNNPGCGTDGFTAGIGWDPVTGFGTPNFGKLLDIVAEL